MSFILILVAIALFFYGRSIKYDENFRTASKEDILKALSQMFLIILSGIIFMIGVSLI